jgi:hypothetical protein
VQHAANFLGVSNQHRRFFGPDDFDTLRQFNLCLQFVA